MMSRYRLRIIPESVVHIKSLSGLREKHLDSGFSLREEGKFKVSGGCYFAVGHNVRVTTSMKMDNCAASIVLT